MAGYKGTTRTDELHIFLNTVKEIEYQNNDLQTINFKKRYQVRA